jgi:hypothetical protein
LDEYEGTLLSKPSRINKKSMKTEATMLKAIRCSWEENVAIIEPILRLQ